MPHLLRIEPPRESFRDTAHVSLQNGVAGPPVGVETLE
jgi:hypothetical protein